jgi:tetratricopeptide (TPR) repeat protein
MPKAGLKDSVWASAGLLAAGLCLALGCQSNPKTGAARPNAARPASGGLRIEEAEPFAGLKALSAKQAQTPDSGAMTMPPPPGVDLADIAPMEAGPDSPARAPLDAVLAKFSGEPAAPPEEHTPNQQALRLYVSGRSKLQEGQAGKAVTDLEAATRLDPMAAEPWRELGEAQLALGRRTSAMASYQKAVKLGLDEPRLLDLLAREGIKGRHFDDAAKLLVQARQSKSLGAEIGLAPLVDIDLAESLSALGYLRASRDLLVRGLSGSFEGLGQSRLRGELSEVLRRRGELWQRAGDISCRLGQYDEASRAYGNAGAVPTLDPGAVIARRVYADMRTGRSARAALAVVEDIRQSEGRVEDRHMGVIRYLAGSPEVGPKLSEALGELSRMVGPDGTPTVMNRLARASAAALSGEQARGVLRARLAAAQDPDLIAELLATHPADDVRGTIAECTKLVQGAALVADTCALLIIVRGQSVSAIVQSLSNERAPSARLLAAALLTRLSRPTEALARLDGVDWPSDLLAPALLERTDAAVANGDWSKAEGFEQQLAGLKGPDAARAHARSLESMQRYDAAVAAITPVVSDADQAGVEDLLLAGDLALRADQPAQAERWLRAAVARDRFDERAHEALLGLYAPTGPLADDAKLTDAARSLRQSIASSRAIRAINAQDLVNRSLWTQAQRELTALLTVGNENPGVLRLLITVWERAAKSDPDLTAGGERWLRAQLAARPESSAMLLGLSRVLVAEGKAAEADALLSARNQAFPLPELARAREWVLREGLERPDEADQIARLRLEKAPRNIDNSIELAEILVRAGDVDEAAQRLTSGVPQEVKLTTEQASRLAAILPKIKPESIAKKDAASLDVALRLFDLIAGRGTMTPQMHLTRLNLLATGHPEDTQRLIAAVDETLAKNPRLFGEAYDAVIKVLDKLDQSGPLLKFLGAAAEHVKPANETLYYVWFISTCAKGGEEDIARLANGPSDNERCGVLLKVIVERVLGGSDDEIPETLAGRRADIARYAGDMVTNLGKDALAAKAYRLALSIKPDHAWAANNLGYQILDAGGDLEEAANLIQMAYKQKDDQFQVIDSMGWLRYKQGKVADSLDEAGAVREEGAVTLLKRALDEVTAGDPARRDPVIMDHAADALWRTGEKERAKELWSGAETVLSNQAREATRNQLSDTTKKRIQTHLDSVRSKRAAVDKNQEPAVAPFARGADGKPVSSRPGKDDKPREPHNAPQPR